MTKAIRIILLGTNGWYDTNTGNTISVLIDCPDYYIVLDAGNGIYKLDMHMELEKPVYLFLSHFHLDHISGLHILNKFNLSRGLTIIGQEGTGEILQRILAAPFTIPLNELSYDASIIEVPRDINKLPFNAEFLPLVHSTHTIGFRLIEDGKIISYCPDTGFCNNAVKLSQNADIVITECANRPGQSNPAWPHLNPETAAGIAKEAGAQKLVLVHFDAYNYQTTDDRNMAERESRKIFENSFAGYDGMVIEL